MRKTWVRAKRGDKNLLIECACGCRQIKHLLDKSRGIHPYISGHNRKGTRKDKYLVCMDSLGYKRIWNPERQGFRYEHRLIYETYYQCCILPTVDIHHVDGNRTNNEISNLRPMNHGAHIKLEANKGIIGFQKGYRASEESKRKMSQAKKGRPAWNKGLKKVLAFG